MVFHASRWDPAWGGELRFTQSPEERWLPRFGALHLFEAGMHNRHEVLLVRGPRPRYTLGCWLFERPARSHRGLRRFLGSLFESRP
jgi:Rps23 Pro-64 3,4-dihydroxylase Tpa1-like proline 4-hydroxylase